MDNTFLPRTEQELERWMKDNCYGFNSYSINGNWIHEGFGIDKSGGLFIWYYTDRGQRYNIQYFQAEHEIVAFAFNHISSDQWANAHCIGCSGDKDKITELKNELLQMNIEFFEDEIVYGQVDNPVYRVMVFGCDIKQAGHLKEKYWTEK